MTVRGGMQSPAEPKTRQGEKRLVDLKADLISPVKPGDSVVYLVRNFAAQHNGAVITCDSAVRYSDMRIECFGNVLINKNTTYIYGDRAEYDGTINEVRIYSDLVKVVDGDATLYTYKFRFNTRDNIGWFADGGVMTNRDNVLEAVRGYYYADTKDLVAVEKVEMRNDEYELKGDSVVYNMESDNAYFFDRTNIWNREGDYLYADRGSYRKADTLYIITRNGYLLTEKQEIWSDSIDYYRQREHAILRHALQLDDTEHKALGFGNYGEYWKNPGDVLLTSNPAVVSYDLEQGDSLFMRGDTIRLLTINEAAKARRQAAMAADSLARIKAATESDDTPEEIEKEIEEEESAGEAKTEDKRLVEPDANGDRRPPMRQPRDGNMNDSTLRRPVVRPDSLAMPDDSLAMDSLASQADSVVFSPLDTMTVAQRKAYLKEEARKVKAEKKIAEKKLRDAKLDSIGRMRRAAAAEKLKIHEAKAKERADAKRLKAAEKLRLRQERALAKGKTLKIDSTALVTADSLLNVAPSDTAAVDPFVAKLLEEWVADSLEMISGDSVTLVRDSIWRMIKCWRNVRSFRTDFQSACDSMVTISTDSTLHLYIRPVLWNGSNQITSDIMDVYTQNQQVSRAEFVGSPMMATELDTVHYSQIAGKEMTAYFRDNEIYREDVKGNVQTIYYMQDGEPPEITSVTFIESGDASFFIEEQQIVGITYRTNPAWYIAPMDKIPADRELYLKGFEWQGERRPVQRDVFDGTIRPTRRKEVGELPHPDFPIRSRIEGHKARLMEHGRWDDRMDQVDMETVEWMRRLGYEPGQPREDNSFNL